VLRTLPRGRPRKKVSIKPTKGLFNLIRRFGPVWTADADTEFPVCGEPHELGVLEQLAANLSIILDDHRLHLIEQQLRRHATEERKRLFQRPHQHRHRLPRVELQPHQSRVAQHHQERVALTPRQPKLSEVDLRLMARRRFEANYGVRCRRRPNTAHVFFDLRVAAVVASRADLIEQSRRRQLGKLGQPCLDDGPECIDLADDRRPRRVLHRRVIQISIQLAGLDPVIDRAPRNPQLTGHLSLAEAALQVVT